MKMLWLKIDTEVAAIMKKTAIYQRKNKPRPSNIYFVAVFCLFAACLNAGCSGIPKQTSWPANHGQVRDLESGLPLKGVVIAELWYGATLHGSVCINADTTTTDAMGRFDFQERKIVDRRKYIGSQSRSGLVFYKHGYSSLPSNLKNYGDNSAYLLAKDNVDKQQRVKNLWQYPVCSDDPRDLWPLWRSIFIEMKAIGGDVRELSLYIQDHVLEPRVYAREPTESDYDTAYRKINNLATKEQ